MDLWKKEGRSWLEALLTWVSNEQTQAQPEGQAKKGNHSSSPDPGLGSP